MATKRRQCSKQKAETNVSEHLLGRILQELVQAQDGLKLVQGLELQNVIELLNQAGVSTSGNRSQLTGRLWRFGLKEANPELRIPWSKADERENTQAVRSKTPILKVPFRISDFKGRRRKRVLRVQRLLYQLLLSLQLLTTPEVQEVLSWIKPNNHRASTINCNLNEYEANKECDNSKGRKERTRRRRILGRRRDTDDKHIPLPANSKKAPEVACKRCRASRYLKPYHATWKRIAKQEISPDTYSIRLGKGSGTERRVKSRPFYEVCFICQKRGHKAVECSRCRCFRCGRTGHKAAKCSRYSCLKYGQLGYRADNFNQARYKTCQICGTQRFEFKKFPICIRTRKVAGERQHLMFRESRNSSAEVNEEAIGVEKISMVKDEREVGNNSWREKQISARLRQRRSESVEVDPLEQKTYYEEVSQRSSGFRQRRRGSVEADLLRQNNMEEDEGKQTPGRIRQRRRSMEVELLEEEIYGSTGFRQRKGKSVEVDPLRPDNEKGEENTHELTELRQRGDKNVNANLSCKKTSEEENEHGGIPWSRGKGVNVKWWINGMEEVVKGGKEASGSKIGEGSSQAGEAIGAEARMPEISPRVDQTKEK